MATLTVSERTQVFRAVMRWASTNLSVMPGITKADLYDPVTNTGLIADVDVWVDGNFGNSITVNSGLNAYISQTARDNLSVGQKTLVLIAVTARRLSEDALRRALGVEVN